MRLQRLKQEFGVRVRLRWHPYALRPAYVPGPFQFAGSYVEGAWQRAARLAQDAGIEYHMWAGEGFPRWSLPGLEAGLAAQRQGAAAFERFHVALFRALFSENRDITAPAVLADVARRTALDVDRFEADLHSAEIRTAVREGFEAAMNDCCVSAVPTVLVGTRRIVGMVPLAEYRGAIAQQLGQTES